MSKQTAQWRAISVLVLLGTILFFIAAWRQPESEMQGGAGGV